MGSLLETKQALHAYCVNCISRNIHAIEHAIVQAREAANNETKSSAGDKHETGRAMLHLEQEKLLGQLAAANQQKQMLAKITPIRASHAVVPGSLLITDQGNFYISVGIGKIPYAENEYYAISPTSPIALGFKPLKIGETLVLNNRSYTIKQIA